MKATGIVRRIDDLGRIVIPKEIRRTMGIREGDPLEIYMGEKMVGFQKYSLCNSFEAIAKATVQSLKSCGVTAAIFDNYYEYVCGCRAFADYTSKLTELGENRSAPTMIDHANQVGFYPIYANGDKIAFILYDATLEDQAKAMVQVMATNIKLAATSSL